MVRSSNGSQNIKQEIVYHRSDSEAHEFAGLLFLDAAHHQDPPSGSLMHDQQRFELDDGDP